MPIIHIPKITHHKASDQAAVRLSGQDFSLGPWRSKTAITAIIETERRIAEWLATELALDHHHGRFDVATAVIAVKKRAGYACMKQVKRGAELSKGDVGSAPGHR